MRKEMMRKEEFFIFIVLQIILARGQTSVLNATDATPFSPSSVNSTVNTSRKGCEFNGQSYNHAERLPGCFKVYCIQGKWLQRGYIDWNCMFCSAYWDPHLVTFDGWFYDYQGTCEYSLAQEGTSRTPRYAVSAKFIECWGSASCVGPSTFKDSEATLIEMGAFGRQAPDLYKLKVNGALYEIPDSIPRLVREGSKEHPVFAWRYNSCIRLLGSSKIAVEKCGLSLAIWVSPDFQGSLYGLCGFYDGKTDNDFTRRDGTVSPLERFPNGEHFPSSWEITCSTNIS
ncbi:mucin-2-like [Macrobrachium rosenbergii]|uniref:mucin-2-like n=1 Tax=Macrobrachium rosenbergii TaxID=79674 RepID=UPI0034D3DFAE